MSRGESPPLACLDANIFLAVLIPKVTRTPETEDKPGFEIARAAIEEQANLHMFAVTVPLAIHAAELRRRYYSKKNAFAYNDGLYLATGLAEHADLLITTDPHLLGGAILRPSHPANTAKPIGHFIGPGVNRRAGLRSVATNPPRPSESNLLRGRAD
jgi:hypothetical protein